MTDQLSDACHCRAQHSWRNFAQATPRWGVSRFELGKLRGWQVDVFVSRWYVWRD